MVGTIVGSCRVVCQMGSAPTADLCLLLPQRSRKTLCSGAVLGHCSDRVCHPRRSGGALGDPAIQRMPADEEMVGLRGVGKTFKGRGADTVD